MSAKKLLFSRATNAAFKKRQFRPLANPLTPTFEGGDHTGVGAALVNDAAFQAYTSHTTYPTQYAQAAAVLTPAATYNLPGPYVGDLPRYTTWGLPIPSLLGTVLAVSDDLSLGVFSDREYCLSYTFSGGWTQHTTTSLQGGVGGCPAVTVSHDGGKFAKSLSVYSISSTGVLSSSVTMPAPSVDTYDYWGYDNPTAIAVSNGGTVSFFAEGALTVSGVSQAGAVTVYDLVAGAYVERSTITAPTLVKNEQFGWSISCNSTGTIIAIGAPGTQKVYILDWTGSAWSHRGYVQAAGLDSNARFGTSVSLSADGAKLLVGAPNQNGTYDEQGAAYLFSWTGSAWTQVGNPISAPAEQAGQHFGTAVGLATNAMVISAPDQYYSGNRGVVYTLTYATDIILYPTGGTISATGFSGTTLSITSSFVGHPGFGLCILIWGASWYTPVMVENMIVNMSSGATLTLLGSGAPTINDPSATVLGCGFKTSFYSSYSYPSVMDLTGRTFRTRFSGVFIEGNGGTVAGSGFATSPVIRGGGAVRGRRFRSPPSIHLVSTNECSVQGRGFSSELIASGYGIFSARAKGRGFFSPAEIKGGGAVLGRGFRSRAQSMFAGAHASTSSVVGGMFNSSLAATMSLIYPMRVVGRGFKSEIERMATTGRGFLTQPDIKLVFSVVLDQAFVMNEAHRGVSRYTDFDVLALVQGANGVLMVTADGVYSTRVGYDLDTAIKTTVTTREWDFGEDFTSGYTSKNVPMLYLDTDSNTKVTTTVDGVTNPPQPSEFGGRRCKLARGARGRYWVFKVDNFLKLQGLEMLPERLQRRVK